MNLLLLLLLGMLLLLLRRRRRRLRLLALRAPPAHHDCLWVSNLDQRPHAALHHRGPDLPQPAVSQLPAQAQCLDSGGKQMEGRVR
jgi:hypothetical protein